MLYYTVQRKLIVLVIITLCILFDPFHSSTVSWRNVVMSNQIHINLQLNRQVTVSTPCWVYIKTLETSKPLWHLVVVRRQHAVRNPDNNARSTRCWSGTSKNRAKKSFRHRFSCKVAEDNWVELNGPI